MTAYEMNYSKLYDIQCPTKNRYQVEFTNLHVDELSFHHLARSQYAHH